MHRSHGHDNAEKPGNFSGPRPRPEDGERESWFTQHVKQPAGIIYQRYFIELVLREKPLPPSKDGRHIPLGVVHDAPLVDERRGHGYISNSIRSSRYTVWDFVPKQFLFQATRVSNFYFICIGVPQTIPGLSTTGSYTTILPLMFFMILTMIKEGYDDYCRHKMDVQENTTIGTVLRPRWTEHPSRDTARPLLSRLLRALNSVPLPWRAQRDAHPVPTTIEDGDRDDYLAWTPIQWQDIHVGDIVKLRRDDALPADLALLYADGEHGVAYIETMALDGETNLKSRQAPHALQSCSTIAGLRSTHAEFVLEDPNRDLYDFHGKVTIGEKTIPLTLSEVVYRGSILRNTSYVLGLVVNSGEECKIRMNANHHPTAKKPRLEQYANQVVLTLIVYVVLLSIGLSMGYLIWHQSTEVQAWYIDNGYPSFKQIIIGYLIMFNNVIPLSLYVSLEIVKLGQMLLIQNDVHMYDEESDTAMKCNTNTILENLGQVSYVLSDKTGTLTENVMEFRKLSIAGVPITHQTGLIEDRGRTSMHQGRASMQQSRSRSPMQRDAGFLAGETHNRVDKSMSSEVQRRLKVDARDPSASDSSTMAERAPIWLQRLSSDTRRSHIATSDNDWSTIDLLKHMRTDPNSKFTIKAREYILALALCHTALPETNPDGSVSFQASSPDEIALVQAAQELGFLVSHRTTRTITLVEKRGSGEPNQSTYEVLNIIEFSSARKRMTIVVRCPDSRLWLICKGADSVMIPRLQEAALASRKSHEVRRSVQLERAARRKSLHLDARVSFGARPSLTSPRHSSMDIRPDAKGGNLLSVPKPSHEIRVHARSLEVPNQQRPFPSSAAVADDAATFAQCFKHLDEFASEGLRTLLYAGKFLEEGDYAHWKKLYDAATTSLVNRQEQIEAAGEMIEQGLDLLGASAIEDKLQKGVPETIDRLRRANIKIWMLTGDKRETAINIAHSARICKQDSELFILDSSRGDLESQMRDVTMEVTAGCLHSVAVIDGNTLAIVEGDSVLKHVFYSLIPCLDSVICCRASPAQKANVVKAIRARVPGALTLAIGDGSNDIAMIQASHVGVGISGKEGLQAARVADYSIAQFRFLQRLLLVHGRWNYVRTARFVLMTFWKEMMFYTAQALYQRQTGYTGTSLYENWSLTVLNTLFTSLCVIIPGIFEQDLKAETLLAVPELYVFGQRNMGLNLAMYLRWMVHATAQGILIWFISWAAFAHFNKFGDNGLFALGDLAFTLGIVWTNVKLLGIETYNKTWIVAIGGGITVGGWFVAWQTLLSGIYSKNLSPYDVKGGFFHTFGTDPNWWLTIIITLSTFTVVELAYKSIRSRLLSSDAWPPFRTPRSSRNTDDLHVESWQSMEKDAGIRARLLELANEDTPHRCHSHDETEIRSR